MSDKIIIGSGFLYDENNHVVYTGSKKNKAGLTWVDGHKSEWPEYLRNLGFFTSIWDGSKIIDNSDYISKRLDIEEEKQIILDLKGALIWQFKMIRELFELGILKGLWSGSDVTDDELKQKYAEWKIKLNRLDELGG